MHMPKSICKNRRPSFRVYDKHCVVKFLVAFLGLVGFNVFFPASCRKVSSPKSRAFQRNSSSRKPGLQARGQSSFSLVTAEEGSFAEPCIERLRDRSGRFAARTSIYIHIYIYIYICRSI